MFLEYASVLPSCAASLYRTSLRAFRGSLNSTTTSAKHEPGSHRRVAWRWYLWRAAKSQWSCCGVAMAARPALLILRLSVWVVRQGVLSNAPTHKRLEFRCFSLFGVARFSLVHSSAVRCGSVLCCAVLCGAVRCGAVQSRQSHAPAH